MPFDLLPYFLPTLCFSHSGILTVPETHQAHCCLGGFAQAAPCQGVPLSSAGRDPFQTSPRPPSPLGHALLFILFTISLVPIVILSSFILILLFLDPC